MRFPAPDTHFAIRWTAPGLFITAITYFIVWMNIISLDMDPFKSIAGMIGVGALGFFTDILCLYKLHPAYRIIRKKFFIALSSSKPQNASKSDPEKVDVGEQIREQTIYKLVKERRDQMRIEHAIWIVLYNMHIISFFVCLSSFLCSYVTSSKQSQLISIGVIFLFISILTLVSGVSRNISYNKKIIFLSKIRNTGARGKAKT